MLEKPNLDENRLIDCLGTDFELSVVDITFLPWGADPNTAVYRATTSDKTTYFVKLRRAGFFDEAAVAIPSYLHRSGIEQIIPPLKTKTGALWADIDPFHLILYPFVVGKNGFEVDITNKQRVEFGRALRQLHTTKVPSSITQSIPHETFSRRWRTSVKSFLERIAKEAFAEPTAAELASFLLSKQDEIDKLLARTEALAALVQASSLKFILCHADIHAWNLLIEPNGHLYIVDWDTLLFAPKERDLMFIGAGLGGRGHSIAEEIDLFYQGYGPADVDQAAVAYYRYERIIEDIAVYCEEIFLTDEGGADRAEAVKHVKSNFRPDGTIAHAKEQDVSN